MDINPKTYPSRAFIRFTAHNQLTADATGRSVVASVQRLGGKTYMQAAEPEGEAPLETQRQGLFLWSTSRHVFPTQGV
jgi:hypothetical protein